MIKLVHEEDTGIIIPTRYKKYIKVSEISEKYRNIIKHVFDYGIHLYYSTNDLRVILDVFKPDVFFGITVPKNGTLDECLFLALGPNMMFSHGIIVDSDKNIMQHLLAKSKDTRIRNVYSFIDRDQKIGYNDSYFWRLFLEDLHESSVLHNIVPEDVSDKFWLLYNAIYPMICCQN